MRNIIFITLVVVSMLSYISSESVAKDEPIPVVSASASSTYYNYSPDKAIDGDIYTYWAGGQYLAPWWITFDMGKVDEVDKINLKWHGTPYAPKNYDIKISQDGTAWEDVYTAIQGAYSGTGEIREIKRKTRYIKLNINSVQSSYPVLREFAAYLTMEVPRTIRFQGLLGDATGVPLEGAFTMTFRLYDTQTGGVPLWEEVQQNLNIVKGELDVELGSVTPISLIFNKQYWLGVEVGSDGEMSPRFKLTSVPYSFVSEI